MDNKKIAIKIIFSKKKDMIFISHLDLVRLFNRIFQKAEIPLYYTKGFNPRPKLSFKRALALGKTSNNEELKVYLTDISDFGLLKNKLNKLLPNGIRIKKIILNET